MIEGFIGKNLLKQVLLNSVDFLNKSIRIELISILKLITYYLLLITFLHQQFYNSLR